MMFRLVESKRRWLICSNVIWLAALATRPIEAGQPSSVVFDRTLFDKMDQSINQGNGKKTETGGALAWGESYIMLGYIEMYRATKDNYYLDKLVDHADHVLKQRDDNRGFRDYSGQSRPAWSVGGKYTVAELVLTNDQGQPVLRFRSTKFAFNDQTTIQIKPRPDSLSFDLEISNKHWKAQEQYAGLSIDRQSPDNVELRVNACESVAIERELACSDKGSSVVTVEIIGSPKQLPTRDSKGKPLAEGTIPMPPLFLAFHGYSGQMTYPMLDFAWMVRQDPKLREEYSQKAEHYIAEAIQVLDDAAEEWRDGPQPGEGHYVTGRRGCPFWSDNVGKAFNYQCSLGRSLIRLAQLTGDPKYERQVKAIARLLKRRLRLADNNCYIWDYGWGIFQKGWSRENSPSFNTPTWSWRARAEDISHGVLEVDFATLCAQAGWVFDRNDMTRFANTFLKNVVDDQNWTTKNRVDGQGGHSSHNRVIGGWCGLAAWEPAVAQAINRICATQRIDKQSTGAAMWTVARLAKWTQPSRPGSQ